MSAIRDLLDLPEEVTKSAFVVRLGEAVHRPDVLMDTYAVTKDIHHALDRGLGLIHAALTEKRNVAAFVHGSFGSGKSHYMAALSLLAGNHPRPWSEPALHDLLAKHEWVKSAKLLRLHLNLIDAPSLGDKLWGAYLDATRLAHPEAILAPLFADEGLFANADKIRAQVGDEKFFAELGKGATVDARWGKKVGDAWSAARYDQARISTVAKERSALFSALVASYFPAFTQQASAYLPFEQALGAMTHHAKELGYDAVVFFLDELVLWLAQKAANPEALNAEIGKLAKLVEGQAADQAVPVVTFAARQRDIGEMVGDQYAGSDAETVKKHLAFWEGRFDLIRLPDRDLPAIIAKRVVSPKNDIAKKALDDAFTRMRSTLGQAAWGTLLADVGDEQGFRQVYPFSPALVEALVAMSHYLQRERTALKILVEMLTGQLEDFEVGKVVPVGDLYDALAEGEEPMDGAMRDRFAAAKRLYEGELLPVLHAQNQTGTPELCQRLRPGGGVVGCANCPQTKCRNDNRIAKTLLLAALAPNTPVFRALTATRLVQLNHGTLKSPVPGAEASQAAERVRSWAKQVGKVRVVGQDNPTMHVVLEGVDIRPVIQAAGHYDTPGAQRQKLRELLFESLELDTEGNSIDAYKVLFRGTDRVGSIQFGNVREMSDAMLQPNQGDAFRFVFDYPFDDVGHSPQEDEQRVESFRTAHGDTPTIVWLPSFFGDSVQKDLRTLVVVERILEPANVKAHLGHLRPDDQTRAREELTSLATQNKERIRRALDAAYGLQKPQVGMLDQARSIEQNFHVLWGESRIRNLAAADLKRGMDQAIEQLLGDRYPRHPRFEEKATRGKLDKELELLDRLIEADGQRIPLAKAEANAFHFASRLGLVTVTDGQATLDATTFDDLDRQLRAEGIDTPEVRKIKQLFDPEGRRGLTAEVADFVVVAYARVRGRELARGGAPISTTTLGKLDADAELLTPKLPSEAAWHPALGRAAAIFGIAVGKARTPKNVRALGDKLTAEVAKATAARAHQIADALARRGEFFTGREAPRLTTATAVATLLAELRTKEPVTQIERLAAAVPATSEAAMLRHVQSADTVSNALASDVSFASFPSLQGRTDEEARVILRELSDVLAQDELQLQRGLGAAVSDLAIRAQRLLHVAAPKVDTAPAASAGAQVATAKSAAEVDALRGKMVAALEASEGGRLEVTWKIVK